MSRRALSFHGVKYERGDAFKAMICGCPKCGVGPRFACVGSRGQERRSMHIARFKAAKNGGFIEVDDARAFYLSRQWRSVRYKALKRSHGCCECCGARAEAGRPLHVDHIKPRSKYPALELTLANLQVLCEDCNLGKSNTDETDWRKDAAE